MHPRLYRLMELHQRMDHELRRALSDRPRDRFAIMRLNWLKRRTRDIVQRFLRKTARA